MAVASIKGSAGRYVPWTRPTDWLALPTLTAGQEKVVALAAVFNQTGGNLFAVNCAGAYTIDWGDGTVENVATGVQRNHTYSYAALSANDTSEGWRQAIVTITPQAANSLTNVNFGTIPTGASSGYLQQWRDIAIVGANVAVLQVGIAAGSQGNALRLLTYVGPSAIATLNNVFRACAFLKTIVGTQFTASCAGFASAFQSCTQLESLPLLDTHSATSFNTAFNACVGLRTIPLFNTGNVTDFSTMFSACTNLNSVPLLDTSRGATFASMFAGCTSLPTIPLLVTTAGTTFNSMFTGCSSLVSVPALDTGNGTDFGTMFGSCASLTTLPAAFNTTKGTSFANMFIGCSSLAAHPTMDVSNGIALNGMFQSCSSLATVSLNSTKATTLGNLIFSATAVRTISVEAALATTAANMFAGQTSLTSVILNGLRFAPSTLAGNQLSAAALNALYTSLGTASGAQTLVVSGNPGSGSSTISIATAKGWTVTGG